jgi:hypothetical protein
MNLKIAFDEAMERHHRVLNKIAADIAGQLADPELRRQAAALITVALFTDEDSDREGPGEIESVARAVHETMPR